MEKHRKRKVAVLVLSAFVLLLHFLGLLTLLIVTVAIAAGGLALLSLLSEDPQVHYRIKQASEWLRKEVKGL